MSRYNLIVIGSGPGGYVAAIRAARLGLSTAIVERETLGGICLNWGCIPTKALLTSAHLLEEARRAAEFGLKIESVEPDFAAIIARSRKVAGEMEKGVGYLMKKNKITVVQGTARFQDRNKLIVSDAEGGQEKTLEADRFIIATGARARSLPGIEMDGEFVFGYREAMSLQTAPARLGIVGAGAIGVEFADFYASMGTRVTMFEYLPALLPVEDKEVSTTLERSFKKRGVGIHTGVQVQGAAPSELDGKKGVALSWKAGEEVKTEFFDAVLMATGIAANTENLGLENLGIRMVKDRVQVDERYQTSVSNIYAIGDCIPGPALAHVASMEGVLAAEAIHLAASRNKHGEYHALNYDLIPGCTYCHPEVASVGLSEQKALAQGFDIKIGRFPFTASGRAKAQGDTTGFVKLITDAKYGQVLGAHIIGPSATELISEYTLGAHQELVAEDFAKTIHAHPTLAEGLMEAAADALGEAVNL